MLKQTNSLTRLISGWDVALLLRMRGFLLFGRHDDVITITTPLDKILSSFVVSYVSVEIEKTSTRIGGKTSTLTWREDR